jgi:hypothetical protein
MRLPLIPVADPLEQLISLDIYSAEYALVDDKIRVHDFDVAALESRRRLVIGGFILLAMAWLTTLIFLALNG